VTINYDTVISQRSHGDVRMSALSQMWYCYGIIM